MPSPRQISSTEMVTLLQNSNLTAAGADCLSHLKVHNFTKSFLAYLPMSWMPALVRNCEARVQPLYMCAPLVPDARFQPALVMRCPATTAAMRAVLVSG
ncbi:hypothetical protein QQF64_005667 [Cirrhinus molitorella]|uniref:Uncharacterized protein n=1 Tax=Cirrhinus molitorella TaxID=172907 RepID=A0ABR3MCY3_9TELE